MYKYALIGAVSLLFIGKAAAFPHCIDYDQTGMMEGKVTECYKNMRTSYSVEELSMSIMSFKQEHNQRTVRKDGKIYSWDPTTLQGTVAADPFANVDFAGTPEDNASAFLEAMGFALTGQNDVIAGEDCNVWTSTQFGEMCMTDDLLMLRQKMFGGQMGFTREATSIKRGTAGDESKYSVPSNVTISNAAMQVSPEGGLDLGGLLQGKF